MRDLDEKNRNVKKYKKCSGCGWAIRNDQSECPNCKSKDFTFLNKTDKLRLTRDLNARAGLQYGF